MDNYFNEYKKNKILLLKLLERAQLEINYVKTGKLQEEDVINLNNFNEKEYIKSLFNIEKENINKEEIEKLIENVRKEKNSTINYENENKKILLGIIYLIEDSCRFDMSKQYLDEYKRKKIEGFDFPQMLSYVKFLDSDIDEKGTMHMYLCKGEFYYKLFQKLGLNEEIVPKSSLDEIKDRIISDLDESKRLN